MRRNIELKVRLSRLEEARQIAQQLATDYLGVQQQTDTYFHCAIGRLKLREKDGAGAELIWYARPDEAGPKASDYQLVPTSAPTELKQALTSAWGQWLVVRKRREIFLYQNVRIHLDEVEQLGSFLEFEAVLEPKMDVQSGYDQLAELEQRFGIAAADRLEGSYSDLLAEQAGQA